MATQANDRREQRRLQHQDLSRSQLLDAAEEVFGRRFDQRPPRQATAARAEGGSARRVMFALHPTDRARARAHYDALGGHACLGALDALEQRTIGEFDGKAKYQKLLSDGEDPGDVVFREKKREDLIRRVTGWTCIRLTWADLYAPQATAARIHRALSQAAA